MRAICLLLILIAGLPAALATTIPRESQRYQRELTRHVHTVWGLDGPVALHAAQIHQESTWRSHVSSSAGAQGLAQFMPDTASWIAAIYPDIGDAAPYSPSWAMAAMVRFNRRIYGGIKPMRDAVIPACDQFAMMLSGYNGGPGWLNRDRRLTASQGGNPDRWWGGVEHYTARADWAMRENRTYARRIIQHLEPLYIAAGWPGRQSCQ